MPHSQQISSRQIEWILAARLLQESADERCFAFEMADRFLVMGDGKPL